MFYQSIKHRQSVFYCFSPLKKPKPFITLWPLRTFENTAVRSFYIHSCYQMPIVLSNAHRVLSLCNKRLIKASSHFDTSINISIRKMCVNRDYTSSSISISTRNGTFSIFLCLHLCCEYLRVNRGYISLSVSSFLVSGIRWQENLIRHLWFPRGELRLRNCHICNPGSRIFFVCLCLCLCLCLFQSVNQPLGFFAC